MCSPPADRIQCAKFVELAFTHTGRRIARRGRGVDEEGVDARTGEVLVGIDPRYFRPTEVHRLVGDPSKARQHLGWHHKIGFPSLCRIWSKKISPGSKPRLSDTIRAIEAVGCDELRAE
jgi:GDP-D-mannose dehydratase